MRCLLVHFMLIWPFTLAAQHPDQNKPRIHKTQLQRAKVYGDSSAIFYDWNWPHKIFCDQRDRIYVVDVNRSRVMIYNSKMEYLTQLGRPGNADGDFDKPWSIFVDGKHTVYVLDLGNARVQVFDSSYNFVRKFAVPPKTWSITADTEGSIYVSVPSKQGLIAKLDSLGNHIRYFGQLLDSREKNLQKNATSLFFEVQNKTLCVSFIFFPRLDFYSSDGDLLESVEISNENLVGINSIPESNLSGLVDFNINIWDICVRNGKVYALIPHYEQSAPPVVYAFSRGSGGIEEYLPFEDGHRHLSKPVSLCVSSAESFYFSTADNRVVRLQPNQ